MSELTPADLRWLDSAARFAEPHAGAGTAASALVVDDTEGIVLGRSASSAAGDFERGVLAEAGAAARGATLYATLLPRPHPVIEAGIARVVIGAADPFASGPESIMAAFAEAGIDVAVADHRPSRRLIEGRAMRTSRGRPFVTLRLAVSRDGMIAQRDGGHVAIMGEPTRRWALLQRSRHGAVIVGARTAVLDEERLDERLEGLEDQSIARVVVLGSTTLPPRQYLERSAAERPTHAVVLEGRGPALPSGIEVVAVPGRNGRPDLRKMLTFPGWGFSSVLVEAGAKLFEAMLSTEMIDRLYLIEGQVGIGRGGLSATSLGGLDGRLRAAGLVEVASDHIGSDRLRTFEPRR